MSVGARGGDGIGERQRGHRLSVAVMAPRLGVETSHRGE